MHLSHAQPFVLSRLQAQFPNQPLIRPMDASILVVGDNDFVATFVERSGNSTAWVLTVVPTPVEALSLIQTQHPDIVVIQASQSGSLDLCNQVKAQTKLSWIFCIVLDDRLHPEGAGDTADRLWALDVESRALERGADAYLWMTRDGTAASKALRYSQECLLRAKIQAGIRMVKTYRELMSTNDLLSAIALADPLTELSNRRALEWELPRKIHTARVRSIPLSLLILDIDHFKAINDTHGHLIGDRALQLVASRMNHNLRVQDTPFRYGGEEFVLILSNTDCREAANIARRLRRIISDQPFAVDDKLVLTITVSMGVTALDSGDDANGTSLLHRADLNLLHAKAEGRNTVVSCTDWLGEDDSDTETI